MNRLRSYVWMVCLLCISVLGGSCSREVVSTPDGGAEGIRVEAGSLRIVLSTPSPDAVVNPGSRADGETAAALHEVQEWTVKKLGVYIFMASTPSAGDANYRLVKKKEGITFGAAGTPGVSGTAMGNGEYSYTEMLEKYMISNYLKVLLVANEGTELGTADADGTSGTTLADFKKLVSGAVLGDSDSQSADKISGGAYTGESDLTDGAYTGLVMSGTAMKGSSEEINLASPASLELEATLTRIVARIDICLNKKGLTLKKAVLRTTARKAYIFPQTGTDAAEGLMLSHPLLPVSKYTEQLGDGKPGIAYQEPASDTEAEEVTRDRNTLKHVFYLYEQVNDNSSCAAVEVTYTLANADGVEQTGVLEIPFRETTTEGDYVNTTRNYLYTVELGDGSLDGEVNARLVVQDWEPNEIYEFLPKDGEEVTEPEP
ncbi:hypothetical protein QUW57_03755 [Phocaeicola plebeius]|uniref:hypothetical protein n=1 Tax=Phocaeicola plebeius TaxID=310297 RepID=UPI0021ABB331|nr:hypothetical protein [Phocaeicola plebeius]MCR8882355.1 hypothetical protein [Phocaeicola plebeius]MDM8285710.1 hypothetical protein [Phocaeicola plebeius]